MISDLLPSAGDEKRHTKGETEYSLSQLSKLHSLTHTHTPFLTLHPFHLPYLPLRATERGVPLLTKSQVSSRESLRRTTPTTTTTTASKTFDIHSSSSYSHVHSSSLPISKKREATTAAFRIPVGRLIGGKALPSPRPLAAGAPSAVSKTTRYTSRQPVDRLYQGRHGECTIRCGPAAPDTLFGISSCVDDIDCFGDYSVM